jgi:hypothetical protein
LPVVIVLTRCVRDLRAERVARALSPALLLLGTVVVLTAPHWLKNLVYYGDPLYPVLREWLPTHPWSRAAEAPYAFWFSLNCPAVTVAGVLEMLKTLVTFAFVPHDFPGFHGAVPVFGALFTLCTPALLLVPRSSRLYWLFAASYLGVAAWFWLHQYDRYLQVLVPWMAAGTAVVLAELWREGTGLRAGVCALVGLQVVWAGDLVFIPAHRAGGSMHKMVIDLLGRGFQGDYERRLVAYPEWEAMGRALPAGSKVLVHEEELRIGLGAWTVMDYPGDQGGLYWGEQGTLTPAQVWSGLREQGVTHVIWAREHDHAVGTLAGSLVFFEFAAHHTKVVGQFGGFTLAALPDVSPPASAPGEVAYYPCDAAPPFAPGLYPLAALASTPVDRRPRPRPAPGVSLAQAIERASFLVFDASCHGALAPETRARFELLATRGEAKLFARRQTP